MAEQFQPTIAPDGLRPLHSLWETFDEIKSATRRLEEVGGDVVSQQISRLEEKIDAFEPAVTLIGQIKAGKTSVVNAMIGQTGFLPSDVNPWTSVVTSLHLNARNRPENTRALFRFFDEEEWDRLVSTGGRLGELAGRAGFSGEQDEIREQVNAMRDKTRSRLGKRFEMLLGTAHKYDTLNPELIDRYVCHGGWDDDEPGAQGRFADITKVADLYLDLEGYPHGLCLRDTPGVNDTFMMREQITINAIKDSRLCVVVLSAHQALSTMDLALLRLIANVEARNVMLFVNRIDELDDPARQIPEIAESFRRTLKKQRIAADIDILFGSAQWAHHALDDKVDELPVRSFETLTKWADSDSEFRPACTDKAPRQLGWQLSGIPALHQLIAQRIFEGPGKAMLAETRDAMNNIVLGIESADRPLGAMAPGRSMAAEQVDELRKHLDKLKDSCVADLRRVNEEQQASLVERLSRAQHVFAERAVDALMSHLEVFKDSETWQYEPTGLRVMMRSAFLGFGGQSREAAAQVYSESCGKLEKIYEEVFGVGAGQIKIAPPALAKLRPPAVVGQTIALDLSAGWWKKWWRGFRGQKNMAKRYYDLILQETNPIAAELSENMAMAFLAENERNLELFFKDQIAALTSIVGRASRPADGAGNAERDAVLQSSRKIIEQLAA